MKVAIVGSRSCPSLTLEKMIEVIPKECTTIISGGAIGTDRMAAAAAKRLNIPVDEYRPEYRLYGDAAPLIRNRTMILAADEVIAFWDYHSKGTRNAILESLKQDKPIKIYIVEEGKVITPSEDGFAIDDLKY